MGIGAAIAGGGALIGGIVNAGAASDASAAQVAATQASSATQSQLGNRALDLQTGVYGNNTSLLNPFIGLGGTLRPELTSAYNPDGSGVFGAGYPTIPGVNGPQINPNSFSIDAPFTNNLGSFAPNGAIAAPTFNGGAPFNGGSPFSFDPTISQLEQTPGYQFSLDQGLKATQNSYAARGLGASGAAAKGATQYAQGLASQTYNDQFGQALNKYSTNFQTGLQGYQTNFGNALNTNQANFGNSLSANQATFGNSLQGYQTNFGNNLQAYNTNLQNSLAAYQTNFNTGLSSAQLNMNANTTNLNAEQARRNLLSNGLLNLYGSSLTGATGLAGVGTNYANSSGNITSNLGSQLGNNLIGAGNAQAAGTIGSANALSNGFSGVGNAYYMNQLLSNGNFGGGGNSTGLLGRLFG